MRIPEVGVFNVIRNMILNAERQGFSDVYIKKIDLKIAISHIDDATAETIDLALPILEEKGYISITENDGKSKIRLLHRESLNSENYK